MYHINAVDEVTQWEVVGATAQISEAWLLPVLEAMLGQFPFRIRGFHSDNGSEFINHAVAQLLNKLLVERQTKSRPRHGNDNGLVESKNGWVIRKHMGYGHISSEHAEAFEEFYRGQFNPYLNFHRPCGVPEMTATAKGKRKRIYRWYATPVGDPAAIARVGGFSTRGCDGRPVAAGRGSEIGHAGRDGDAGSETQTICGFAPPAQRMRKPGRAVEMTVPPPRLLVVAKFKGEEEVKPKSKPKETSAAGRFASAFRLILNEKMLEQPCGRPAGLDRSSALYSSKTILRD